MKLRAGDPEENEFLSVYLREAHVPGDEVSVVLCVVGSGTGRREVILGELTADGVLHLLDLIGDKARATSLGLQVGTEGCVLYTTPDDE